MNVIDLAPGETYFDALENVEVTAPPSLSRYSAVSGSAPAGMTQYVANIKDARHVRIHDAHGVGWWSADTSGIPIGGDIFDLTVTNIGWAAPDRGHGHGIYIQNYAGFPKSVDSSVFVAGFGIAAKLYGERPTTEANKLTGVTFRNSIFIGSGYGDPGDFIVGGTALRFVQGWVLAEPIFALLIMLFAVGVQRRSWAIMMVAAAMASLQRYVGVALMPAGLVALWMMGQRRAIPAFAVGAGLPVGLWMARNVAIVGAPMGVRVAGAASLDMSVQAVLDTLIGWLPLLIVAWQGARRARLTRAARMALAVYCTGHVVLVVWGAATTNLDAPGDRLLAPMFAPALLLVAGRNTSPPDPLSGGEGEKKSYSAKSGEG